MYINENDFLFMKRQGMLHWEMSEQLNVSETTLSKWKKANGHMKPRQKYHFELTVPEYNQYKTDGLRDSDIADKLEISLGTLNRWKKANGVRTLNKR